MCHLQIGLTKASFLGAVLSTAAFCLFGCAKAEKKADVASLIKSSVEARLIGHEDLAANYLKEAFDSLPAANTPERLPAVDQLYCETLILAKDLRKSGRLSLSDTMYDKAIEIEQESSLKSKQSARKLKQETEKVFDIEENILAKATDMPNIRASENKLRAINDHLKLLLKQGDFAKVESEGKKHLETVRNACGTGSPVYEDVRKVYGAALFAEDKSSEAIDLMQRDAKELTTFTDDDLKNADAEAVQDAYFLGRLLYEFSDWQVKSGDFSGAEKSARQSLHLADILGGKLVLEKAYALLALASALKSEGRYKEALNAALSAQPLMKKHGAYLADQVRCLMTTCQLEDILGLKKDTERNLDTMIYLASTGPDQGDCPVAFAFAASYFRIHGNEKKYLELKNKAITNANTKGDKQVSRSVFELLGDGAAKVSQPQDAVSFYDKALKLSTKSQEKNIRDKIARCQ